METPNNYKTSEAPIPGRDQEAALIGAVLRRPALYSEISESVKPKDFGFVNYQYVWEAMQALTAAETGIDTVTVGDEMQRRGVLAEFAHHDKPAHYGRAALAQMRESGQPQNARHYAVNVQDYAANRKLLEVFSQGANWIRAGRRAAETMVDIEHLLAGVNPGLSISKHTSTLLEATREAVDRTDRASRGEIQVIPSGFKALDNVIGGFVGPDLTIIGARPGQGKTALLASIAANILPTGKKIAFFTLEMARVQVAMRFISMFSGISYQKQLTGKLTYEDWEKYNDAVEKIEAGEYGLYLNDLPAISPNRIRQELRRLWPVDVVMIDYLQLVKCDSKADQRWQQVGEVSRGLKSICKEFNIPLVVAAQINRESEKRGSDERKPRMSDLRESGDIEADADKIILLHRPTDNGRMVECHVAKQRNGPTGMVMLDFVGERTLFQDQIGLPQAEKSER